MGSYLKGAMRSSGLQPLQAFVILYNRDGSCNRVIDLLGKMPTASVQRLISPIACSYALVEFSCAQCWAAKAV
jgi:hypothetical protein